MRTWDIVNVVEPSADVTSVRLWPKFKGLVTSAVTAAFIVGVSVTSASQFRVSDLQHAATAGAEIKFVDSIPFFVAKIPSRKKPGAEVDTQLGQSTAKLSQRLAVHFTEATDEEPYEDDYSFS